MTPFSNARNKRRTVCLVLLVWLFALASGVANACLLEAREAHAHVVSVGFSGKAPALSLSLAHAGAVADAAADGHQTAPCLKVCDDGTRSFPKQDSTVAQADPGPAPLVLVLWGAVAPVVPALRQRDVEQPATPGLPIRVRFSRLAI